jgi:hypothetical protein
MRLYEQVNNLKSKKTKALEEIQSLEKYLTSIKFHTDTTVQVKDILNRIENVKIILIDWES